MVCALRQGFGCVYKPLPVSAVIGCGNGEVFKGDPICGRLELEVYNGEVGGVVGLGRHGNEVVQAVGNGLFGGPVAAGPSRTARW